MKASSQSTVFTEPLPENFEMAVELTGAELEQHLRLMAALKMFELGKISSGKAAELAGMGRVAFFDVCGRYRVSLFNYPPEEIEAELQRELETLNAITSNTKPLPDPAKLSLTSPWPLAISTRANAK